MTNGVESTIYTEIIVNFLSLKLTCKIHCTKKNKIQPNQKLPNIVATMEKICMLDINM